MIPITVAVVTGLFLCITTILSNRKTRRENTEQHGDSQIALKAVYDLVKSHEREATDTNTKVGVIGDDVVELKVGFEEHNTRITVLEDGRPTVVRYAPVSP